VFTLTAKQIPVPMDAGLGEFDTFEQSKSTFRLFPATGLYGLIEVGASHGRKGAGLANRTSRQQLAADDVREFLHGIVKSSPNPSQLFELYYWSCEAELVEFVRQFLALPEDAQQTLSTFLAASAGNPLSVKASSNRQGEITLTTSIATQSVSRGPPGVNSTH
jgi:hypothetical protein